jgi:thioredoxin 1
MNHNILAEKNTAILTVSDQDFTTTILQAPLLTIVDFWADWCPPCRALEPVLAQLAQHYAGKVRFARMNVEEQPQIPMRLSIQAMPTLVFFKDGQEVERIIGAYPQKLKTAIEKLLAA